MGVVEDAFPSPPLPAIFNNILDEGNFSISLNFFNNNDPYASSKHKSKMCKQTASYLAKG